MRISGLVDRTAAFLRDVAVLALAFMMLVTCADIVLRWTINAPIFGAFELVELSQIILVFLALPWAFARGMHITVNILDGVLPPVAVGLLKLVGAAGALVFIGLVGTFMISPAYDAYRFGDRTMDLSLLRIWFWLPVFVGIAGSIAICAFVVVRQARGGAR